MIAGGGFVRGDGTAAVSVVVVAYNNAADLEGLLRTLRAEAAAVPLRLVVADNGSGDGTVERLSAIRDATVLMTGGNLGYAGGINAALRAVPPGEPVLVLNPDLELLPGCIAALLERMRTSGAGVVAPQILGFDGRPFRSLRREPSALRALGDALFGARWLGRPGWLSEEAGAVRDYRTARRVEWASGAALLISPDAVAALGDWDEDFFLYSEETEYQHRARGAGFEIWYEPAARVRHRQGASGASRELLALMAVNRVRYREKLVGARRALPYRAAVALHELLRSRSPEHRHALRAVLDRRSWERLPRATRAPGAPSAAGPPEGSTPVAAAPEGGSAPLSGTIIIPAHDEERTIHRSLGSAARLADEGAEVIVACNGCTDATPEVARRYAAGRPSVTVLELEAASKIAALNAADAIASHEARIYLDADIEVAPEALRRVLRQLDERQADGRHACDAARPVALDDTSEASWLIRSHYRARSRMPYPRRALWGAGVYGLSGSGRRLFDEFPEVVADDLFVDRLVPQDRRVIVETTPVVVVAPRDPRNLLGVLRRGIRAKADPGAPDTTRNTVRELAGTVRGPLSAVDAAVFAGFAVAARWSAARRARSGAEIRWERDASSR